MTRTLPAVTPIDPPPEPDAIPLGPPDPVGTRPAESWFSLAGLATARNVGQATLTAYLPDANPTRAAVIVAAGGGYLIEAMANEAWPQARWLADRGIAAFVLKYRLEPTPADPDRFAAALVDRFSTAADPERRAAIGVPPYMIDDAIAALRYVREHAAHLDIDPARIGFLGFSAGAMIGLGLVDAAPPGQGPAFLGTIYPAMAARPVRADAPPLFVAMAADDPLYGRQGYGLVEGWLAAGRTAELHVYAAGGHGFGMGRPGTTSTATMAALHRWLVWGGWAADRDRGERDGGERDGAEREGGEEI